MDSDSLNHWLSLNQLPGEVTIIPERFVVMASPEPAEEPDYETRAAVRALLAAELE